MADNTLQTGSSNIATDDVGAVHYQRVKLDVGADGAASPVVGSMPTYDLKSRNALLTNGTVTWANSAVVNTEQLVDMPAAGDGSAGIDATLLVIITNPSTATALTVASQIEFVDNVTTRFAELAVFSVPANRPQGLAFLVDKGLLAGGGRLSLKNDTAIGAAGTFTSRVQVWQ